MAKKFKVITLCGSTRFEEEFEEYQRELTLEGNVVLSVGVFGHGRNRNEFDTCDISEQLAIKQMLDNLHRQKIDMCNEIFVINPDGYIGESTWREIVYASMIGKRITSINPIDEQTMSAYCDQAWRQAELLALRQLDIVHHSYGIDTNKLVTLSYKRKTIIDPWLAPEHQSEAFAWTLHDEPGFKIDPNEMYGRQKMANFVFEVDQLLCEERERTGVSL